MSLAVITRSKRLTKTLFAHLNLCSLSIRWIKHEFCTLSNRLHSPNASMSSPQHERVCPDYLEASDSNTEEILSKDMLVHKDFISEEEEHHLLEEMIPYLSRLRYEYAHWDNAIHGYRETERKHWTARNKVILERVKQFAFPPTVSALAYVHILDLAEDGYIKPHIDAVRFCGDTIAGLSLLSPCVMRLVNDKDKMKFANILLQPRSLYIMKDRARYEYTHEVLPGHSSVFKGQNVPKTRRISVICRNEPEEIDP
ncbi:alpha-ketoglutarate-dependent dioxygenase alkB homolog 7, mitochondrial-like [Liolophura sinensis]|uniref:alpha-ketoglutarate-dependent dioxygenase alkB homolog 7, mitochondrial-like n=1 Tax=Liolophura sinensis TaxID=3198878 RepID=UPI0031582B84